MIGGEVALKRGPVDGLASRLECDSIYVDPLPDLLSLSRRFQQIVSPFQVIALQRWIARRGVIDRSRISAHFVRALQQWLEYQLDWLFRLAERDLDRRQWQPQRNWMEVNRVVRLPRPADGRPVCRHILWK